MVKICDFIDHVNGILRRYSGGAFNMNIVIDGKTIPVNNYKVKIVNGTDINIEINGDDKVK